MSGAEWVTKLAICYRWEELSRQRKQQVQMPRASDVLRCRKARKPSGLKKSKDYRMM